ncbi:MAG: hypothetical protein H0V45_05940 [Actinobacteria bacterium]|nr:hypothetical protein [Actinomycetota bacterium]
MPQYANVSASPNVTYDSVGKPGQRGREIETADVEGEDEEGKDDPLRHQSGAADSPDHRAAGQLQK